jgi:hypothetical protein
MVNPGRMVGLHAPMEQAVHVGVLHVPAQPQMSEQQVPMLWDKVPRT